MEFRTVAYVVACSPTDGRFGYRHVHHISGLPRSVLEGTKTNIRTYKHVYENEGYPPSFVGHIL